MMNVDTGEVRGLIAVIGKEENPLAALLGQLQPNEVLVNTPSPECLRCKGKGSIPLAEGIRAERRRAEKAGLPIWAKFMPCPECNFTDFTVKGK